MTVLVSASVAQADVITQVDTFDWGYGPLEAEFKDGVAETGIGTTIMFNDTEKFDASIGKLERVEFTLDFVFDWHYSLDIDGVSESGQMIVNFSHGITNDWLRFLDSDFDIGADDLYRINGPTDIHRDGYQYVQSSGTFAGDSEHVQDYFVGSGFIEYLWMTVDSSGSWPTAFYYPGDVEGTFTAEYELRTSLTTQYFYSVPEPGTLALFAIGLAGMGLVGRRKKA